MKKKNYFLQVILVAISFLLIGCGQDVKEDDVISYVENLDEYKDWNITSSEIVLSDTKDKKYHSYNVDITATSGYMQLVSHKQVDYQKYDQGWEVSNTSDITSPEITLSRELTNDEIIELYSERTYSFSQDKPELTIQSINQDIENNSLTIVMDEKFSEKFGTVERVISEDWVFSPMAKKFTINDTNIDSVDSTFNYDSFVGETVTKGTQGNPYYRQFKLNSVEYNSDSDEIVWSGYIYYVKLTGGIIEGDVSGTAKYFERYDNYQTNHSKIINPKLKGFESTLYYDVVFDMKKGIGVGFESGIEYSNE